METGNFHGSEVSLAGFSPREGIWLMETHRLLLATMKQEVVCFSPREGIWLMETQEHQAHCDGILVLFQSP